MVDDRFDYGEVRNVSAGFLDDRMVVVVWTVRGIGKKRGVLLGSKREGALSSSCREKGATAVKRRADARAADIAPAIRALQRSGATSLRAIGTGLNAQGIPTV